MTSIEEHKKKIEEHLEEINDAIEEGIEKKPVTIGFHCSACALQFLELYLQVTNKIPVGKIIKHDWFKTPHVGQKKEPLIERKLPVVFLKKEEIYQLIYGLKEEIYQLIYGLEEERNSLVYGKPTEEQIKKVLEKFLKIKEIFYDLLKNEKFEL